MISDKRLEELLRDAHEVEGMERAAGWGFTRLSIWSVAAVIVCGLMVWTVYQWPAPPRTQPLTTGTIKVPNAANHEPGIFEQHGSVVMAVAEDAEGKLKCVKWSADALQGKGLDEVGSNDLARAGLALQCDAAPARMLVVGLQGPLKQLPDSDKRAVEIAECILKTPACGVGAFDAKYCAQAGCAGGEVHVRVETIALK